MGRYALALLLLAGGLFPLYPAGSTVYAALETRAWEPVAARILSLRLDVEWQTDPGERPAREVLATYEYEYGGRTYRSNRVGLTRGRDSFGSYHDDLYRELQPLAGSGRSVTAYADPDEPSRAVLHRDIRWDVLAFQIVAAVIFLGLSAWLFVEPTRRAGRAEAGGAAAVGRHGKESETAPAGGAGHRVRSSVPARTKLIGLMAAFTVLMSVPVLMSIPAELSRGNRLALVALVVPAFGALLAAVVVRRWIQWRKFGGSELELASSPVPLGGVLEGEVHTNVREAPESGFRITLTCVRQARRSGGSRRRRHSQPSETVLWRDTYGIPPRAVGPGPLGGVTVPVRFEIPLDEAPAGTDDPTIAWWVEVEGELPGVDFGVSFVIPMVPATESAAERTSVPSAPEGERTPVPAVAGAERTPVPAAAGQTAPDEHTRRRATIPAVKRRIGPGGGVVWEPSSGKQSSVGAALFGTIFLAIGVVLYVAVGDLLFTAAFGGFGLLTLVVAVDTLLRTRWLEVRDGTLILHNRILGRTRIRRFPASHISGLRTWGGRESGGHSLAVMLDDREGDAHILATQLPSHRAAHDLIEDLEEALGLGAHASS